VISLSTKVYIHIAKELLVIAVKLKGKENFCTATVFLLGIVV
jgi:hypothetical protein